MFLEKVRRRGSIKTGTKCAAFRSDTETFGFHSKTLVYSVRQRAKVNHRHGPFAVPVYRKGRQRTSRTFGRQRP